MTAIRERDGDHGEWPRSFRNKEKYKKVYYGVGPIIHVFLTNRKSKTCRQHYKNVSCVVDLLYM